MKLMGKVKFTLIYSLLFCIISINAYSQIDGVDFNSQIYVATYEYFFSPEKIVGKNSTPFPKSDTAHFTFRWSIDGKVKDLNKTKYPGQPNSNNVFFKYLFKNNGTYNVELEVTDTGGRTFTKTHEIVIENPIEVPNIFTPNGDNQNDRFVVKSSGNPDNKLTLTIYTRNGEQIYSQTSRIVYWDGRLASGQKASEGVYYYIITTEGTPSTPSRTEKGFFHLYR
jgi:gliding motility-associated-like protein